MFCRAQVTGDAWSTCRWPEGSRGPASLSMFKEPCHEHSDVRHFLGGALLAWSSPGICLAQGRAKSMLQKP